MLHQVMKYCMSITPFCRFLCFVYSFNILRSHFRRYGHLKYQSKAKVIQFHGNADAFCSDENNRLFSATNYNKRLDEQWVKSPIAMKIALFTLLCAHNFEVRTLKHTQIANAFNF